MTLGAAAIAMALGAAADEPTAEDILNGKAPSVDYSQAERCLRSERIDRTEALNDKYLVFHLHGNETWLAQFPVRCPGLAPNVKLMFEKTNQRICAWDTVRVLYDNGFGMEPTLGPRCTLPKFEPVSEEQVAMLKSAILAARKSSAAKQQANPQ